MKKKYFVIRYLAVCLLYPLIIISCWSGTKEERSVSTNEKNDESFRNALRDNLSDIATTNEIAEQELKRVAAEAEQERMEQELLSRYSWMDGEWSLSFSINDQIAGMVNFKVTMNINTTSQSITFVDHAGYGTVYRGKYNIDETDNTIYFDDTYIAFDPSRQLFYETIPDEWGLKKRIFYHKR